jgi:hypothetical protein
MAATPSRHIPDRFLFDVIVIASYDVRGKIGIRPHRLSKDFWLSPLASASPEISFRIRLFFTFLLFLKEHLYIL